MSFSSGFYTATFVLIINQFTAMDETLNALGLILIGIGIGFILTKGIIMFNNKNSK